MPDGLRPTGDRTDGADSFRAGSHVFTPNHAISPITDDGRIITEAKLEPKDIIPEIFASVGHTTQHKGTIVFSTHVVDGPSRGGSTE